MIAPPRPEREEYAPSLAGYVARIADNEDVVAVLADQVDQVVHRLSVCPKPGATTATRRISGASSRCWATCPIASGSSPTGRSASDAAIRPRCPASTIAPMPRRCGRGSAPWPTSLRNGGPSGRRPSPCSGTCRRRPGSGAGSPATTPSASARSPTSLRGTCATISRCSTRAMASEPLERLNAALAGRYALAHELGSGGMATVYLADDLKHHRPVAVKVLRPELASVLGPE